MMTTMMFLMRIIFNDMKDQEFKNLVKRMRIAQKEYRRSRSGASLSKKNGLERAVDDALNELQ